MTPSRSTLSGRRGWSAVVGLSTVLTVLVAGQLPAASADDRPAAATATASVLLPSSAPSPGAVPELPGPVGPVAAAAAPISPAVAPVRQAPAEPTTPKPATAKPAAAKPAAAKPAAAKPAAAKPAAPQPAAPQPAAAKPAPSLCSGDGWQHRRGAAALASLKGGAQRTGFRVQFRGARKGYLGLTHLQERRIEMFVRACGTQSDELLRHVMAHELGHAYDTTHGTTATRRAWMAVRGIPAATPWYGCSGCTDFATPAGDFAEVYAQWARGSSTNRSQLSGDVPPAALAKLAQQFFGA